MGGSVGRDGDEDGVVLVDELHLGNHLVQLGLRLDDALDAPLLGVDGERVRDVADCGTSVVLGLLDSGVDLHDLASRVGGFFHYITCNFCALKNEKGNSLWNYPSRGTRLLGGSGGLLGHLGDQVLGLLLQDRGHLVDLGEAVDEALQLLRVLALVDLGGDLGLEGTSVGHDRVVEFDLHDAAFRVGGFSHYITCNFCEFVGQEGLEPSKL